MGLKLGPALKIRAQVSACWGQWSPDNGEAAPRLCVWLHSSSPAGPIQARLSTGGQAPGPSLLHGQLPRGSAAAATNAAGSREGAQLGGAAPVPSTGPPRPMGARSPLPAEPHPSRRTEPWLCSQGPRTPPSLCAELVSDPPSFTAGCSPAKAPNPTAYPPFGFGCKNTIFKMKTHDLRGKE